MATAYGNARVLYHRMKKRGEYVPELKGPNEYVKWYLQQKKNWKIDDKVRGYFNEFVETAESYGHDVSHLDDSMILIKFMDKRPSNATNKKDYAGQGATIKTTGVANAKGRGNDKVVAIYIYKDEWAKLTPKQQKWVVFHELGHDVMNLGHDKKKLMKPSIPISYTDKKWKKVMDDLFKK